MHLLALYQDLRQFRYFRLRRQIKRKRERERDPYSSSLPKKSSFKQKKTDEQVAAHYPKVSVSFLRLSSVTPLDGLAPNEPEVRVLALGQTRRSTTNFRFLPSSLTNTHTHTRTTNRRLSSAETLQNDVWFKSASNNAPQNCLCPSLSLSDCP
jgi:hypothetical protein